MDTMGADLRGLLAELHERGQEHDARQERHGDRLRNLEPETAWLCTTTSFALLTNIGAS